MTEAATTIEWRITGDQVSSCNCDWACPCQFNDVKPTHDHCEALFVGQIREGHVGDMQLDGVRWAEAFYWPGPVHLGEGSRMLIVDEAASSEQRSALEQLTDGALGHPFFEIFSSVTPNKYDPVTAPISLEFDRDARTATISIGDLAANSVEPIRNPVSDEPARVRIDLPNGFEYRQAEVANSTGWYVNGPGPLALRNSRTYTHLTPFDWSSDGTTR